VYMDCLWTLGFAPTKKHAYHATYNKHFIMLEDEIYSLDDTKFMAFKQILK